GVPRGPLPGEPRGRPQVPGEAASVDAGEPGPGAGAQGGGDEPGLGAPLPVERGLAAPGAGRDALHGDGVVAVLPDLVQHGVEELLLTLGRDLGAARGGSGRFRSARGLRRHRFGSFGSSHRYVSVPVRERIGTRVYRYLAVSEQVRIGTGAN